MVRTLIYLFFLFLVHFNSLALSKEKDKIEIGLDYQVQFQAEFNYDIMAIKYFLEDYINSDTFEKRKKYFQHYDDDLVTYQYDSIPSALERFYPTYEPTIIAFEDLDNDEHLVKVLITGGKDKFHSILSSHDLILKDDYYDCFKIVNTAENKLRSKNCIVSKNLTIYTDKETVSDLELQKYKDFELGFTNFFDLELIEHNVAVFETTKELYRFLGYDYHDAMYLNDSYGGMFIPRDKLILSANNSVFYPHEIVHLYINELDLDTHDIVNEGIATFLGGSLGHDYSYHVQNLKNYINLKNIKLIDFFMNRENYNRLVSKNSSFRYSFGAFLSHLAYQNNGKEGLIKLLNSGKSNAELKTILIRLFTVEEASLEDYLQQELRDFKSINDII